MKIRQGAGLVSLVAAIACAGLLVGCQSANMAGDRAPAGESSRLAVNVAEVEPVTQAVYETAYSAFAECMRLGGVALVGERMIGVIHEYSYPSDGSKIHDQCYASFAAIDMRWQIANAYDSHTYVAFRECLREIGVQPADNVDGIWAQIQENKVDPTACTMN